MHCSIDLHVLSGSFRGMPVFKDGELSYFDLTLTEGGDGPRSQVTIFLSLHQLEALGSHIDSVLQDTTRQIEDYEEEEKRCDKEGIPVPSLHGYGKAITTRL